MAGTTFAFISLIVITVVLGQDDPGYRLQSPRSYVIVASRSIRPGLVYQVHFSVIHVQRSSLNIRASIRRDGVEYSSLDEGFTQPSTRLSQMQIPDYLEPGNYTLLVEGYTDGLVGNQVFRNETLLHFSSKQVSVFVQTDKAIYQKRSTVHFRVIAVQPNLLPVSSGSVDIYIKNAAGHIVRRWLAQQIYQGFYEGQIEMAHPAKHGWWTILVQGWGHSYESKFYTENYYYTLFDVNVTLPTFIYDIDHGVGGTVVTKYAMSGIHVRGNATVELEIARDDLTESVPKLSQALTMVDGVNSFFFSMSDIKKYVSDPHGCMLTVSATFYDWHSLETKTMKAVSYVYSYIPQVRFLGGRIRVFRPKTPFTTHIAVYMPDGSRVTSDKNRLVLIYTITRLKSGGTITEEDVAKVIPDDGIVTHTFTPHKDAEKLIVRVSLSQGKSAHKELVAYRHYTNGGDYLKISSSTKNPSLEQYMIFTVSCTTLIEQVHYLISASGNIVSSGILYMNQRQKTFSVATSRDMLPEARMVVYGLTHDGEVLTDALSFHVSGINGSVKVRVNKGKNFNLDTVELSGRTTPGALLAFSAEKYSLYKMEWSSFLTKHKVESDLLEYESLANTSYQHTWYHDEGRKENIWFPASSYAIDANTTFSFAGLLVFTDATIGRISNAEEGFCNHTRGFLPCSDGSCYTIESRCDGTWQCEDGADELGCRDPQDPPVLRYDPGATLDRLYFHHDSTQWAWKYHNTKPDGRIDLKADLPMRPGTWLVGAVSLSSEAGLAFTEEPHRVDTTRPFYIVLESPKAAFRGEQIGMQVSVFNKWDQPLEIIMTLEGSSDYKFVHVEDFGIVSAYKPRTSSGDIQTMIHLLPGKSRFVHFPILPVVLGKVTVTIHATSFVNSHKASKTITIAMDGLTNHYHTPYLVDMVSRGSLVIPDLEIPVPERFISAGQREHLYVPGSQKATVSVVGDVVGPGFFIPHLDARSVLGIIHGKGEDYAVNFGLNLYWLRFLKVANQLTRTQLEAVLNGMNKDLQIIYTYIQSDGSLAVRKKKEPSDVWTTSVGLELLSQALDPEYEHILFVDSSIVSRMADWLCDQQNLTTGAFINPAMIYATKMMHNGTDENFGNVTLTAQAVIGLNHALNKLAGGVKSRIVQAINLGGDYLARMFPELSDPYMITMVTYALHEIHHKFKGTAYDKMRSIQREGEFIYWSRFPIPPMETRIINTVQYLQPRPLPGQHTSAAVAATSYGLLVYLHKNRYQEAAPIMRWLQTQRNTIAGFDSVQDTLIATQALTEYGIRDRNRDLYSILLTLQATSTAGWQQDVYLQVKDLLTTTSYSVPNVWGSIRPKAQGTGLALIQLSTEVNVEYPQLMRQFERSFDLDVETLRFSGRNSSIMEMNVCTRWVATHIAPRSGAVTLEVDIPTGFHVRKQQLRIYQRAGRIHSKRSRWTKHKVVLYMDYIDQDWSCWFFPAERWYPVANASIQHRIRIYESSELGLQNNTMYTTYNLFHNHICMVCGSFQCPYCPSYNGAYSINTNDLISYVAIVTYIFFLHMSLYKRFVLL